MNYQEIKTLNRIKTEEEASRRAGERLVALLGLSRSPLLGYPTSQGGKSLSGLSRAVLEALVGEEEG